jgi:hypothetical protein
MKTGKWLLIILIAALLAVYYLIGSDYIKQHRHNVSLPLQIAAETQALALIPAPPADLEERLAAAINSLQTTENSFSADTNDIHIVNTVLRLAEKSGVKAIPLGTAPWVTEKVADRDYAVFRVNLEATGAFGQLLSFLDRLESGEPKTLVIEYLSLETGPEASVTESEDASAVPLTANIRIAVYALLPAAD